MDSLRYKVVLRSSEEGYSVSVPALPGCHSQGRTEAEALENIQDAIQGYLVVLEELMRGGDVRVIEVTVDA